MCGLLGDCRMAGRLGIILQLFTVWRSSGNLTCDPMCLGESLISRSALWHFGNLYRTWSKYDSFFIFLLPLPWTRWPTPRTKVWESWAFCHSFREQQTLLSDFCVRSVIALGVSHSDQGLNKTLVSLVWNAWSELTASAWIVHMISWVWISRITLFRTTET